MAKPKPGDGFSFSRVLSEAQRTELEMTKCVAHTLADQLDAVAQLLPASAEPLKASIRKQTAAARAALNTEVRS